MTDARTTIQGNRLGLEDPGELIVDSKYVTPAVVAGTSAATFQNDGMTTFGSTLAGAYILAAPTRANQMKWLVKNIGSSLSETVTASLATFGDDYSATTVTSSLATVLNFVGSSLLNTNQAVQLLSTSTSRWTVLSKNSTRIAVSS